MHYTSKYNSPLGEILIAADDIGLIGVWFQGQKFFANSLDKKTIELENETITQSKLWLDEYFCGKNPKFTPKIHLIGTSFQISVWEILKKIPYGKTITYGEIASKIANQRNLKTMSSQAVGGAIGHNKISIIIPCHRVVGANGTLTGYAGGIDKKAQLLKLENAKINSFIHR